MTTMTQNIYLGSETTKRYDIPISHLDYTYVRNCNDIKELEKILKVLRSGEEGSYPELEKETEQRLEKLNPKSRVLRKDAPVLTRRDLDRSELESLDNDLQTWTQDMASKEESLIATGDTKVMPKETELVVEDESDLPPVRTGTVITADGKKIKAENEKSKPVKSSLKTVKPRSYQEWDKFDIDNELEKADKEPEKPKPVRKTFKAENVTHHIDTKGMTDEEKRAKAVREKDKGNEAFHSHDYDESIVYYTRSISIVPLAATYNNRALAYLRLSKWDEVIQDCNYVLKQEPENIKALLRRGTALKGKNDFRRASHDMKKVLDLEPNNKTALNLMKEINAEELKKLEEIKEKGQRMIIEEVDGSDEENVEEIEVEQPAEKENHTPLVNGHTSEASGEEEAEDGSGDKVKQQPAEQKVAEVTSSGALLAASAKPTNSTNKPDETKDIWAECEVDDSHTDAARSSGDRENSQKLQNNTDKPAAEDGGESVKPTVVTTNILHETTPVARPSSPDIMEEKSEKSLLQEERSDEPQHASEAHIDTSVPVPTSAGDEAKSLECKTETEFNPFVHAATGTVHSNSDRMSEGVKDREEEQVKDDSEETDSDTEVQGDAQDVEEGLVHARPVFIQRTLSSEASELRENGNGFFRSGQYPEAISVYSQIISKLEAESDQAVNLSLIYSNRAACYLKIGDCQATINDCTTSLDMVPHSTKPLMRRAIAYENLERYGHAYIDYKHVQSLDSSAHQAHQGASRCQHTLHNQHGRAWREKIPALVRVSQWDIPKIVSEADATAAQEASAASVKESQQSEAAASENDSATGVQSLEQADAKTSAQGKKVMKDAVSQKPVNKEDQFEEIKTCGNKHVQKGEYEEAAQCYCQCLEIFSDRAAIYTNRALCYIKLNKAQEAETDCNKALHLESKNTKAYYRRALARKMSSHYKDSLADLLELLRLEPSNTVAKREMEQVKGLYKKEFDELKHQPATKKPEPEKKRTRLKIEEVEDEEEEPAKPTKPSTKSSGAAEKPKSASQPKSATAAQAKPSHPPTPSSHPSDKPQAMKTQESRKPGRGKAKKGGAKETSMGLPVTPTAATPKPQGKITPYEFIQHWNCLKQAKDIQPYVHLLEQVSPEDLPSVISNKLDGHMLQIITRCAAHDAQTGEVDRAFKILCNLRQVPRFSTVVMFLSSKEKQDIRKVLESVGKLGTQSAENLAAVRKDYGVK